MSTNELSLEIRRMEQDLLDLKTSILRVNNSAAGYYQGRLNPGRYLVTYDAGDFPILSHFEAFHALISPSTPSGNQQYFYLGKYRTKINITSNRKILSVTPAQPLAPTGLYPMGKFTQKGIA